MILPHQWPQAWGWFMTRGKFSCKWVVLGWCRAVFPRYGNVLCGRHRCGRRCCLGHARGAISPGPLPDSLPVALLIWVPVCYLSRVMSVCICLSFFSLVRVIWKGWVGMDEDSLSWEGWWWLMTRVKRSGHDWWWWSCWSWWWWWSRVEDRL